MDAIQASDIVVQTVEAPQLNFFLQELPLVITINIKKTFIKNQAGIEMNPDVDVTNFSCIKCNTTVKNSEYGKDTIAN